MEPKRWGAAVAVALLLLVGLCVLVSAVPADARTDAFTLELVAEVPPQAGVSVEHIEAIQGLDSNPNELLFDTQNQGARCGGGTPASIWRVVLDPDTGAMISLEHVQSLTQIQITRRSLFEASDGTLLTGGGWCGYKPPYVSTDQGQTWQPADSGPVHPPNSTFSLVEFDGHVYAGTGYDPVPGEVYRWLGQGNWERVLTIPKPRTIVDALAAYEGELFVGSELYGSGAGNCAGTVSVYVSPDGNTFQPTSGIPGCHSVVDLLVVDDQLVARTISYPDSSVYMVGWNRASRQWEEIAAYPLQWTTYPRTRLVAHGGVIYAHGKAAEDPSAGIYRSADLGRTWQQIAVLDAPIATAMAIHDGTLYIGTDHDVNNIAYLYRVRLDAVVLTPPNQAASGPPGSTIRLPIRLGNQTGAIDTFSLTLGSHAWDVALSEDILGPLAHGESLTFTVNVTIPVEAAWYATDTVVVSATSVTSPTVYSATATLTTQAYAAPQISISPHLLTSTQLVDQVVTRVLTISNGYGVTLTFDSMGAEPEGLVLWNKLGSEYEVLHSEVGENGTIVGTAYAFEPAQHGKGYVTKALGPDCVQFPGSVIHSLSYRGTIELWINPKVPHPVPYQYGFFALVGQPVSGPTVPRNRGNVYLYWGDGVTGTGLYGGVRFADAHAVTPSEPTQFEATVGQPFHAAISWDIDGIDGTDDKVRVYRDGVVVGSVTSSWNPDGTVLEDYFRLGQGPDAQGFDKFITDNILVWNYAKTDFSDRFTESPIGSGEFASWLTTDPVSGTVATNSSVPVQVRFDATGLQPGDYTTEIQVRSNDPLTPSVTIPVTMTVLPGPDMGVVRGTVSDAWSGLPLTATVELSGIYSMTASPEYQIWAHAGTYSLTAYASGYVTVTRPVTITAGGLVTENLALELARPRIEWAPPAVFVLADPGEVISHTLRLSNTGGLPLDVAFYEIEPVAASVAASPANLIGKRILYDRAHGEPSRSLYSELVDDAIRAGAEVSDNWYFPVDAQALEGFDVLWVSCCGSKGWRSDELSAVRDWLKAGGAVLVQGESSQATRGPAGLFGIAYEGSDPTGGTTTHIADHPISQGVTSVYVDETGWYLLPGSAAVIVVYDPLDQPHIVAQEQAGGRMVVVASEDFANGPIDQDHNRLLASNVLAWLARPIYSDLPWFSAVPQAVTVPAHGTQTVTLSFDATGLASGVHQAFLAIEHNDPAQPLPIELPITLRLGHYFFHLPLVFR